MKLFNKENSPNNLSIKGKLVFLFRDSFFFGGLRAFSLIFPLLTVPILTRYFSIENYGLYDSLLILSGFISSFLVFGQDSAVARWFYQVEESNSKKKIVSESMLIQLTFTFLTIPTLIIFRQELALFYLQKAGYNQHILLILVYSFLLLLNNFTINLLKWTYDRKKYAIISILKPCLILISLLVVIISSGNIVDFLIYNNIALMITTSIGLFFCRKWIIIPRKLVYLKKLLYYGLPLGLMASTATLLPAIDRKMIATFLNFEYMGIYSLAFKIAAIVVMVEGIFHMAWGPFSMSIFKEKDAEMVYNAVLKLYFVIIIFMVFVIRIASPILIKLLGTSEYSDAIFLILPLSFALMIKGIGGITGIGIHLSMKTYLSLIPFVFSTLLLIGLLYYLIPLYQLKGVVYSLLIANTSKMIIMSIIARKVFKEIRINYELIFGFFIILGVIYYLIFEVELNIVVKIIIILSVLPILFFLFFFNKKERDYLNNSVKKIYSSHTKFWK